MMTSQEVLSTYEMMVELTEQMLASAGSGDWDEFVLLEQRVAGHVSRLKQGEMPVALEGQQRLRKVAIIKQLLDDDRKIRDLTTPWMAQLSALINSAGAERRLGNAYGRV